MKWINCKKCNTETVEFENGLCEECYYQDKNKAILDEYWKGSATGVTEKKKYKNE